jgi:hypothetical protein
MSVMEKPRTRIHTTPMTVCDMMTISMTRGRCLLGCGISSAKWAGPSRPIRVEKLLNNPSKMAKEVDEYLDL